LHPAAATEIPSNSTAVKILLIRCFIFLSAFFERSPHILRRNFSGNRFMIHEYILQGLHIM
jgi:hypothetical protein